MLFTVETVSCLGACGLAPVLLINEDVHGQVTPEMVEKLIDDIVAAREQRGGVMMINSILDLNGISKQYKNASRRSLAESSSVREQGVLPTDR